MYVSAQDLDFLDLAENCSFPNQKRAGIHPVFPDGYYASQCRYPRVVLPGIGRDHLDFRPKSCRNDGAGVAQDLFI
jgi:hypothetical protein